MIAVQKPDGPAAKPTGETVLTAGHELVMLGNAEQHDDFRKAYP